MIRRGKGAPALKHNASHRGLKEEKQTFVSFVKAHGKRGEINVKKRKRKNGMGND